MEPKIGILTIKGFRALRDLKIEGFGRVTLITGRNNTGKSSVLEALRVLASDASPTVVTNILRFREEDSGDIDEPARPLDSEGLFPLSSLFNGFPEFSTKLDPVVITSNGRQRSMALTLEAGWFSEERQADGSRRWIPQQQDLFGEADAVPALLIKIGDTARILTLDVYRRYSRGRLIRSEFALDESRLSCVFVSPYGGEGTAKLGPLWDKIALSDRENDVVEALRIIDPDISAVSMVGGEGPRQSRTAIVRSTRLPRPVPLRSFGDGLNRLFGIILSLVNAREGLLLIDEFENGMHHTVQTDAWRAIFKLASRLDIQVVATSHSWDAIEAFQKAASETEEEGVLIRLTRKGDDIIPTVFREDELAIATRDRIEVR
ncbi:MAG TPA: AAA family ATPase [Candidatus Hydrogenedentes bacterium]|nr:AAA family ATPase [Candidatus Hydrogenedentota bacterium]HOV74644.1 AAA family ATPase [Candidatus Hydrogenedentota bacterium]HPC15570.1 AAA family ATPase [Candidatus Hydrogenedentota bacterium]HRT19390.1 AAA family ATPase [Candidatus Hydrogenedentota bacterium]HRT63876.1 AAA family ATPase [Candidatus Hydrogenedentota bacterium]